jgi:hypothetical protein
MRDAGCGHGTCMIMRVHAAHGFETLVKPRRLLSWRLLHARVRIHRSAGVRKQSSSGRTAANTLRTLLMAEHEQHPQGHPNAADT